MFIVQSAWVSLREKQILEPDFVTRYPLISLDFSKPFWNTQKNVQSVAVFIESIMQETRDLKSAKILQRNNTAETRDLPITEVGS